MLPFVAALAGQAWVRILNFAMLYTMLALGLNIVVGFAGLLDLGYIAFYAVGAYIYALLASPHFGMHLPFWVILPIGAAIACLFGVLLGAPTLEAARRLPGDRHARLRRDHPHLPQQPECADQHHQRAAGHQPDRSVPHRRLLVRAAPTSLFGVTFTGPQKYYYMLLLLTIGVIVVNLRLQNSRLGRAWEAIREDEIAAKAMGINTRNVKLLAFAMGASFGGIAGAVFSATQQFVSPESFGLFESIIVLAMVVLGGMGNIPGVILGAVLLTLAARSVALHDGAAAASRCSAAC